MPVVRRQDDPLVQAIAESQGSRAASIYRTERIPCQFSSRMIETGFTIAPRRAGITLAISTVSANNSGAVSHIQRAGELLTGISGLKDRNNARDANIPSRIPKPASQ